MQHYIIDKLRVYSVCVILMLLISCKKEKQQQQQPVPDLPATQMEYFNLNDQEIKAGAPGFLVDLNHDGRKDIAFSTLLVGDPVNQVDKLQFLVQTNIQVNLPVNAAEEIPVMSSGDRILVNDFGGYHWFELSSVMLVQKITSFTAPPFWEGLWKNAVHKYVPFQIIDASKTYCGWVELSADIANERLLIHKAAISMEPNKIVKAGI